ncbi:MAG: DUF234 domain-containing protein [Thermoproteus sp.]
MGSRKRGIYQISDNLFRFWFRFVYPNLSRLELGDDEPLKDDERLSQYFGEALEEFVRRFSPALFGAPLGKYIRGDVDVDLAGEIGGCRIYGEVKWGRDVDAERVARDLARKVEGDAYVVIARGFAKRVPGSYTLRELFDALERGERIDLCRRSQHGEGA